MTNVIAVFTGGWVLSMPFVMWFVMRKYETIKRQEWDHVLIIAYGVPAGVWLVWGFFLGVYGLVFGSLPSWA